MLIRGDDISDRGLRATEITSDEGRSRKTQQIRIVEARPLLDHVNHTSAHLLLIPNNMAHLVTTRKCFAEITQLKPFYYYPDSVTPLNIPARDSDESVVSKILEHDFSDPKKKLRLVKWH